MNCFQMQYELPYIGVITLIQEEEQLSHLFFGSLLPQPAACQELETALFRESKKQLTEYLAGKRLEFHLPLRAKGTSFQERVWQALQEIAYGETKSYRQIAQQIGNPKACRAVGLANNRNPLPILIPCHRVIGADGSLVGYGGGLEIKQVLLHLEAKQKGRSLEKTCLGGKN